MQRCDSTGAAGVCRHRLTKAEQGVLQEPAFALASGVPPRTFLRLCLQPRFQFITVFWL